MKIKYKDPTDQKEWTGWRKANFEFFVKELENEESNKIILDLGAGERHFRQLLERFKKVIAVDFEKYEGIDIVADLTKILPIEKNYADIILLSNVLEHIPYPEEFLNECFGVLKLNGKIIGTVPFALKIHQEPFDYNRYTRDMLKRVLSDCGFKNIDVRESGSHISVCLYGGARIFNLLYKTRFSKNYIIHRIFFSLVQLFECLNKFLWNLFKPIYVLAKDDSKMPEGYSFKAFKLD